MPLAYPEWAHHHWVWLARSNNTQSNQINFYRSWVDHNIPVGAMYVIPMVYIHGFHRR